MAKILIIEDEASIRRVLQNILTEEFPKHQIYDAEDGIKGLEILKKESIDLVLCDIKMPKMDGIEVLEKGREMSPDTHFVMIDRKSRRLNSSHVTNPYE